jgi:hypothetical protein
MGGGEMSHLGDTNKMVDTPRTDAAKKIVLGGVGGDWEVVHIAFSRQLERELNAANDRIKRLEEAGDMMEKLLPEGSICDKAAIRWTKAREAKL